MTKFTHNPDYTCLAQAVAFDATHKQLERYTFPFAGFEGDEKSIKDAIRHACRCALESRERREVTVGRLHVEIEVGKPWCGRVVDHIARETELKSAPVVESDIGHPSPPKAKPSPKD